jgi:cell division protein FtsL
VNHRSPFLVLWTLAVVASMAAFVLHLALRGKNVTLGYQLGRARNEQARLREVKRVLELEAASYKTPQRVEMVARTLLGMGPPSADRIVPVTGSGGGSDARREVGPPAAPATGGAEKQGGTSGEAAPRVP